MLNMDIRAHLSILIRARCPLVVVETREEGRVEQLVRSICLERNRPGYSWDLASGMTTLAGDKDTPRIMAKDHFEALLRISACKIPALFVLKDFHTQWKDAKCCRQLKSVAQQLVYSKKNIIVTTHSAQEIPEELSDIVEIVSFPLPEKDDLRKSLAEILKTEGVQNNLSEEEEHQLLEAAKGLTYFQAQRAFAKAIVQDGSLSHVDINYIIKEKRAIIRESDALEFYPVHETPSNVGGLGALKAWFTMRKEAFSQRAKEFGLPSPKGIALIGIPGTGKSLSAKMVGNLWGLPLVRLDVGALFGSYVGQSELRTREALQLAEAISPCVLWIDEMEKAFAHGGNDSGTSTRVFGTILTWMSEKTAPCFVVATANDISKLPPELLRRGRFDEIFFLDLPTEEERKAIFEVHIRKRGREIENFDIDQLVEASSGYVGAEIEHAVVDGLFLAFAEEQELTTEHIVQAIKKLVPLSVAQRERVAYLRRWLVEGRAQSASYADDDEPESHFVELPQG